MRARKITSLVMGFQLLVSLLNAQATNLNTADWVRFQMLLEVINKKIPCAAFIDEQVHQRAFALIGKNLFEPDTEVPYYELPGDQFTRIKKMFSKKASLEAKDVALESDLLPSILELKSRLREGRDQDVWMLIYKSTLFEKSAEESVVFAPSAESVDNVPSTKKIEVGSANGNASTHVGTLCRQWITRGINDIWVWAKPRVSRLWSSTKSHLNNIGSKVWGKTKSYIDAPYMNKFQRGNETAAKSVSTQ
ncbi:MAG: hypothetical protein LW808_003755 [Verrucomicrobiota bacterium]|nr:MAG: hypothetical protein LW808_003755 [Verrucomicrobiota bacterium]